MNTFGKRLKVARDALNMKQKELGDRAGIYESSISHLEADRRKPSIVNLLRLCMVLNVSTDYLLGRTDCLSGHASPDSTAPVDPKILHLMNQYAKLSKKHRNIVDILLDTLVEAQDNIQLAKSCNSTQ